MYKTSLDAQDQQQYVEVPVESLYYAVWDSFYRDNMQMHEFKPYLNAMPNKTTLYQKISMELGIHLVVYHRNSNGTVWRRVANLNRSAARTLIVLFNPSDKSYSILKSRAEMSTNRRTQRNANARRKANEEAMAARALAQAQRNANARRKANEEAMVTAMVSGAVNKAVRAQTQRNANAKRKATEEAMVTAMVSVAVRAQAKRNANAEAATPYKKVLKNPQKKMYDLIPVSATHAKHGNESLAIALWTGLGVESQGPYMDFRAKLLKAIDARKEQKKKSVNVAADVFGVRIVLYDTPAGMRGDWERVYDTGGSSSSVVVLVRTLRDDRHFFDVLQPKAGGSLLRAMGLQQESTNKVAIARRLVNAQGTVTPAYLRLPGKDSQFVAFAAHTFTAKNNTSALLDKAGQIRREIHKVLCASPPNSQNSQNSGLHAILKSQPLTKSSNNNKGTQMYDDMQEQHAYFCQYPDTAPGGLTTALAAAWLYNWRLIIHTKYRVSADKYGLLDTSTITGLPGKNAARVDLLYDQATGRFDPNILVNAKMLRKYGFNRPLPDAVDEEARIERLYTRHKERAPQPSPELDAAYRYAKKQVKKRV